MDNINLFRQAMENDGLQPGEIEPGPLGRCPGAGKSKGNTAAWFRMFPDGLGGVYGDYSSDLSKTWQADRCKTFTPAERSAFNKRVEESRKQAEESRKKDYADAALKAVTIYENANDDSAKHPYYVKKRVNLGGLVRCGAWPQRGWDNALIFPIYDSAGNITSIQAINTDGTKDFLSGGLIKGCFYPIGKISGATGLIAISEGVATGAAPCEVMGCSGVAAMSDNNLEAVAKEIRKLAPDAEIIIIADDDQKEDGTNPGKDAATKTAKAIGCKWVIPDLGIKADAWDVFNELGADGIRAMMAAAEVTPIKIDHQFRFISAASLTCSPASWLIKNYIEEQTTASFFGAAGSMKTFITIDMGLCIAAGKEWHGHRVKQGPVLYICGEGKAGIAKRVNAWGKNNSMKAPLFFVSSSAAQLLSADSLDAVELAANEVAKSYGTPVLIIIDTLNRNFGPGDENSTSDMTAFIQAIDQLKDRLRCAIIIVHHSGLGDAKRGRGSSALRGAMDFEYSCDKSGETIEEQVVTLTNTKTKDHETPTPKSFKPIIVDLCQIDEDMKPITSLALKQTEGPTRKAAKLSGANLIALDALKAITHKSGEATEDSWRKEAYSRGIAEAGTPDAKKKAFSRARRYLLENYYIATRDDLYWIQGRDNGPQRANVPACPPC